GARPSTCCSWTMSPPPARRSLPPPTRCGRPVRAASSRSPPRARRRPGRREHTPRILRARAHRSIATSEVRMEIVVRGKGRSVPARLEAVTRTKAAKIARFTHDAGRVEVDYSEVHTARQDARQLCEVTVHLKRRFLKAHAAAGEPETALDLALAKVEQQVARLKDKRVRGRRTSNGHNGSNGADAGSNGDGGDDAAPDTDDDAAPDGAPRIVKTKRFAAKPMDPEEA